MTLGFETYIAGAGLEGFVSFMIFAQILLILILGIVSAVVFIGQRLVLRFILDGSKLTNRIERSWNVILTASFCCCLTTLVISIFLIKIAFSSPAISSSSEERWLKYLIYIFVFLTIVFGSLALNFLTLPRAGDFSPTQNRQLRIRRWSNWRILRVLAMVAVGFNIIWTSWFVETDFEWMGDHDVRSHYLPSSPIFAPPRQEHNSWSSFFYSGGGGGPIGGPRLRLGWGLIVLKFFGIVFLGFPTVWIAIRLSFPRRLGG